MGDQRRYNDKEIAKIFEQAAKELESARQQSLMGEGLSLKELQAIGAESGIPAEFIARAAASLYQGPAAFKPEEKYLGVPISVSHTVDLPRMLTEDEWNALVVDLRATFDAKGKIEQDGAFRQWTNGNLQILLEPIGKGSRLRMKTTQASAKAGLAVGPFYTALALIFPLIMLFKGYESFMVFITALIFLVGWSVTGYYALKTPKWAKLRKQQMEAVASRMVSQMDLGKEVTPTAEAEIKPLISLDPEPIPEKEKSKSSRTRLRS